MRRLGPSRLRATPIRLAAPPNAGALRAKQPTRPGSAPGLFCVRRLALSEWMIDCAAPATFARRLILLRHEREWCGGLRKWVAQHGHRSRLWARATVSLRRMVAIEFGTCRSGRIGGAAGSITGGKVNRLELRAGRS